MMVRVPTDRQPTHPGIILLEEFLEPMDISQTELAKAINVPYQRINDLINGRRSITPGKVVDNRSRNRTGEFFFFAEAFFDAIALFSAIPI